MLLPALVSSFVLVPREQFSVFLVWAENVVDALTPEDFNAKFIRKWRGNQIKQALQNHLECVSG